MLRYKAFITEALRQEQACNATFTSQGMMFIRA
jgi:hypothetical protein